MCRKVFCELTGVRIQDLRTERDVPAVAVLRVLRQVSNQWPIISASLQARVPRRFVVV